MTRGEINVGGYSKHLFLIGIIYDFTSLDAPGPLGPGSVVGLRHRREPFVLANLNISHKTFDDQERTQIYHKKLNGFPSGCRSKHAVVPLGIKHLCTIDSLTWWQNRAQTLPGRCRAAQN